MSWRFSRARSRDTTRLAAVADSTAAGARREDQSGVAGAIASTSRDAEAGSHRARARILSALLLTVLLPVLVLLSAVFLHVTRVPGPAGASTFLTVLRVVIVLATLLLGGGALLTYRLVGAGARAHDRAAREIEGHRDEVAALAAALSRVSATSEAQAAELREVRIRLESTSRGLDALERGHLGERFAHLAQYDPLTGLPNRALFRDQLAQALARAERGQQLVALLLVDLDRLKVVNETLGYEAGDAVVRATADRVRNCLRKMDTVVAARFAGATFAVILEGIPRVQAAEAETPWPEASVARRLFSSLEHPFVLDGREVFVTASIGIALYPRDGADEATLTANAEVALRRAKEQGGSTYRFFRPAMDAKAAERLSVEAGLRRALERDELLLYYQPRIDPGSGWIVGVEALVRWAHPERGLVSPAEFIPAAEDSGLIVPIGEWVLHRACAQAKAWQAEGLPPLRVSVNVSARQFRQGTLVPTVARALKSAGLDPEHLELEVTESTLMLDKELGRRLLGQLEASGVQLCLDDFGTGYSSLAYLKHFPIDVLKIDRSFVAEMTSDPDVTAIVDAIIVLGRSLRLVLVAEGVETEEQLALLHAKHCDAVQGYLFSRPLSAEAFTEVLRRGGRFELPGRAPLGGGHPA